MLQVGLEYKINAKFNKYCIHTDIYLQVWYHIFACQNVNNLSLLSFARNKCWFPSSKYNFSRLLLYLLPCQLHFIHFFCDCNKYNNSREKLYLELVYQHLFLGNDNREKFINIMTSKKYGVIRPVSKFSTDFILEAYLQHNYVFLFVFFFFFSLITDLV